MLLSQVFQTGGHPSSTSAKESANDMQVCAIGNLLVDMLSTYQGLAPDIGANGMHPDTGTL
jgi:hypothetical protein